MMVSFTQYWRSKHVIKNFFLPLTIFTFIICACSTKTDEKSSKISVENVKLVNSSEGVQLTGDVSVELENTLIEALKKGVPLEFSSEFRIFKSSLFGVKILFEKKRRAVLEYHGITRRFSVILDGEASSAYYESLTEALAACLSIKDWIFFPRGILPENMEETTIQVQLMLDEEALPRPISIVASSDESWQLSSGWVDVYVGASF